MLLVHRQMWGSCLRPLTPVLRLESAQTSSWPPLLLQERHFSSSFMRPSLWQGDGEKGRHLESIIHLNICYSLVRQKYYSFPVRNRYCTNHALNTKYCLWVISSRPVYSILCLGPRKPTRPLFPLTRNKLPPCLVPGAAMEVLAWTWALTVVSPLTSVPTFSWGPLLLGLLWAWSSCTRPSPPREKERGKGRLLPKDSQFGSFGVCASRLTLLSSNFGNHWSLDVLLVPRISSGKILSREYVQKKKSRQSWQKNESSQSDQKCFNPATSPPCHTRHPSTPPKMVFCNNR